MSPGGRRSQDGGGHQDVFILSKDHHAVLVYRPGGGLVGEIPVGPAPSAMALAPDGRLLVVDAEDGMLRVLDGNSGAVSSQVQVGVEPMAVVAAGSQAWVALARESALVEVDVDRMEVLRRIELPMREPRGLALVDENHLYVSHFYDGHLSVVDTRSGQVTGRISVAMPSNPLLYPNQLASLTVSPQRDEVVAPHQEANNDPDGQRSGNPAPTTGNTYYVDGPSGMPAVVPAVATVDPRTDTATSDTDPPNANVCSTCTGTAGVTPLRDSGDTSRARDMPMVQNIFDTPVFGSAALNGPVAAAYVDGGRGVLLLYRGTDNAVLLRRKVKSGQQAVVAEYHVGAGADGLAVSPDGRTVYVYAQFDHTVHQLTVESLDDTAEPFKFKRGPSDNTTASVVALPQGQATTGALARDTGLAANVDHGRRLFYGAQSDKLTIKGAVSCQSCHPDGRSDGMIWTFGTQTLRNTPQLGGTISETAPFHWTGDRPSRSSMNQTIQQFMGGTGLENDAMEDLWAFIDTVPAAQSPLKYQDELAASVARGESIFFSEQAACATCHSGTMKTDGRAYDVGTSNLEANIVFGTPVLKGLAASGPYLHDGREASLESLVRNYVATDLMGAGSHLSQAQLSDLVNYLKTL